MFSVSELGYYAGRNRFIGFIFSLVPAWAVIKWLDASTLTNEIVSSRERLNRRPPPHPQ